MLVLVMVTFPEIVEDIAHQFWHGWSGMVSGDVGVKILPDAFDLVFIRAVRWKKVHLESLALLRRETESHLLRAVNRIVVQVKWLIMR